MIIECQTCHARFRLDESKIKGRGARVKCRKCGEGIIVLKDGGTGSVSPEPGRTGGLDLSTALRDSAAEMFPPAAPPPPVGNLIPFPGTPRAEEPTVTAETPSPFEPVAPHGEPAVPPTEEMDEVDRAFERVLAAGEPPSLRHPEETETPAPMPMEFTPDGGDATPAAHLPEPGEEPDLSSIGAIVEPPPEEPPPAFAESGFLISDAETLDFLKEEHRASEAPRGADISFAISADPVDLEATSLREPAMTTEAPQEARAEGADLPAPGGDAPTEAPPEVDVPPFREEETAAAEPQPPRESPAPAAATERPTPSIPPAVAAVAALLAIALAVAGYLGLTKSGRKTLEGVAPGAAALLGGKSAGKAESRYEVKSVIGYYESGAASKKIYVIKGQVANLSSTEKSGIRILAAMLDGGGKTLAESTVYAGNVVSGETLKKGNREAMNKELSNPLGDGLANMHVPPGKSIPFMVLFFDPPQDIDSYRLEAKDSP